MCHLAVDTTFGSRFGVKVCDEEADKPRAMPSIVLMRTLAEKYPEADFIFALGGDQVSELPSWQAPAEPGYWDEIEDAGRKFFMETRFLIIDRPGSALDNVAMPPSKRDPLRVLVPFFCALCRPARNPSYATRHTMISGFSFTRVHACERGPCCTRIENDRDRLVID